MKACTGETGLSLRKLVPSSDFCEYCLAAFHTKILGHQKGSEQAIVFEWSQCLFNTHFSVGSWSHWRMMSVISLDQTNLWWFCNVHFLLHSASEWMINRDVFKGLSSSIRGSPHTVSWARSFCSALVHPASLAVAYKSSWLNQVDINSFVHLSLTCHPGG